MKNNGMEPDVEVSGITGKAMMWGGLENSLCGNRSGEDAVAWIHRRIEKVRCTSYRIRQRTP